MVGAAGDVMTAEEWGEYLDGLGDLGRSRERRREMEGAVQEKVTGYLDECALITEIVRSAHQIAQEIVGPCTADGGAVDRLPQGPSTCSDELDERLAVIERECDALRAQLARIRERF